jgi:iron complex outermembrane receptor protein
MGGASALALALAVAPEAAADPALDDPSIASIDEVVVTARKRSERLRDVPTAGTALGIEAIREMGGVPTAQSLLSTTPGVNFANTSNPVTSEVSIRGSGTSRATNASAGVGLYRNGAYIAGGSIGGRTLSDLDLFDVERIEVLRGVQGGLNGRNAVGGSVNVVSARPSDRMEGYVVATVGNLGAYEVEGAVNLPINDQWAVRISGDLKRQDRGFYKLYLLDDYADSQKTDFVRGQVRYANGPFTANLLVEHGRQRLPGLVYQLINVPSATYPNGLAQDKYNLPWNSPSAGKQQVNTYEFTASYDAGFAEISTISLLRERRGLNAYDRDATSHEFIDAAIAGGFVAPGAIAAARSTDYGLGGASTDFARIFYQDVHLTGAKVGKLVWLAGAEWYLLHDEPRGVLGRTPTAANPSPGTINVTSSRLSSYAAYGSLGYDITSTLNLAGDLRVTRDEEEVDSERLDLRTGAQAGVGFAVNGKRAQTNVSYTVTISYKPFADMLLYGKVGSAYRAGGFNTALGDPRQPIPVPLTFSNETVTAYEIGYKGNITPDVYVSAAAYQNRFDNLVVQGNNGCAVGIPACPVQATNFAFNAGPARLWGLEAEVTYRTYLFDGPLRVTVGGARQGGKITGGVYDGLRQPQQPRWTATFNVNYRHEVYAGWTGFANLKGSGRWGGVQEIQQTPELDDYLVLDGRLGLEKGPYELSAFAQNLGNESYIVFRSTNPNADIRRYNLPRTYGVQLRYAW